MVILENIDIDIDIDMDFLENIDIDIDKGILQNINIDKISYRLEFGISNRAMPTRGQFSGPLSQKEAGKAFQLLGISPPLNTVHLLLFP